MRWLVRLFGGEELAAWRSRARESILEVNDGIVTAAGIAEGFASTGAGSNTLVVAGVATILAGGFATAGARYSEVRTEWEMNRAVVEAERDRHDADPEGELEELVGIYEAKGLQPPLARTVAEALSERDPVAAHTDAELQLAKLGATSGATPAAAAAGLSFGIGAAAPMVAMLILPHDERMTLTFLAVLAALALTGWFASWLTGLPTLRLVLRNVLIGVGAMAASLLIGLVVDT